MSLVIRVTGEIVDLQGAATDELAAHIDRIRGWRGDLADAEREIAAEIVARMDRASDWTAHVGDYEVQSASPATLIDYDLETLQVELERLVSEGLIDRDAADEAVRHEVRSTPAKSRINRLLKLGGEVRARLEATQVQSTRPRRVKVTRRPQRAHALPRTPQEGNA